MASNISEWFQNEQSKETYLLGSTTIIYIKYTIETHLESKYLSVAEKKNASVHSAVLFFSILNEDTFLFKVY